VSASLKPALDRLYAAFDVADSAVDPVNIVRRYPRVDDREIIAFVAAGLAFGRVASVIESIDDVRAVLGPSPARFVRRFDPETASRPLRALGHRWTRGADLVALVWVLRQLLERHGSLERAVADGLAPEAPDVGEALDRFTGDARSVDLGPAYGRVPRRPGVYFFFSRPSAGSACKRLNLFLRWMVRQDAIDPGGWTRVPARQLVVPLDTHTIRTGRCLGLTRRVSPGWLMAADVTEALRRLDPDDPVRYDFGLCHLSMMGACGFGRKQGSRHCPLRDHCRPGRKRS
jgi:uncharacterized protein (TIGR02757 family)